jgi:hypothetical protein
MVFPEQVACFPIGPFPFSIARFGLYPASIFFPSERCELVIFFADAGVILYEVVL